MSASDAQWAWAAGLFEVLDAYNTANVVRNPRRVSPHLKGA